MASSLDLMDSATSLEALPLASKEIRRANSRSSGLPPAGLVAVARDERVLRFGIVCGDDVGTLVSGGVTVGRAATAEQHAECACGRSESQSFLLHGIHILLIHYFQSRKTLLKKKAGVNTVASTSVFVLMVGSLSLD